MKCPTCKTKMDKENERWECPACCVNVSQPRRRRRRKKRYLRR